MLNNALLEYHTAKQVKPPDPPPRSATINKTSEYYTSPVWVSGPLANVNRLGI